MPAPTLISLTPDAIGGTGGTRIEITGGFVIATPYTVQFGLGAVDDPYGHSGNSGQGLHIFPRSLTQLVCHAPALVGRFSYTVTVTDTTDDTSSQLVGAIQVLPRQYRSAVFELRQMFGSRMRTGPRAMAQVKEI